MMEHRWYERLDTALSVLVFPRSGAAFEAVLRNVSKTGMFVQTSVALSRHVAVVVELPLSAGGSKRTQRVNAFVVHATGQGLGLESERLSSTTIAELHRAAGDENELTSPTSNEPPRRRPLCETQFRRGQEPRLTPEIIDMNPLFAIIPRTTCRDG